MPCGGSRLVSVRSRARRWSLNSAVDLRCAWSAYIYGMVPNSMISALCVALLMTSCQKREDPVDRYTLQGQITDYSTGGHIAHAKLLITAYHFTGVVDSKQEVGIAYSDPEGKYSIRPMLPDEISFDTADRTTINIRINKEGYQERFGSIPYASLRRKDTVYTFDFQLNRK